MNILILGGGGCEHALAWAAMQNPKCDKLIVAPGNAGIAQIADCTLIDIEDGGAVTHFAEANAINFVIIGPEAPLAAGVANRLRDAGLLVFDPSAAAAGLEASRAYVYDKGVSIVVKADGLAAGKGVIVAETEQTALDAIDDTFSGVCGGAGAEVVIEELKIWQGRGSFVFCSL